MPSELPAGRGLAEPLPSPDASDILDAPPAPPFSILTADGYEDSCTDAYDSRVGTISDIENGLEFICAPQTVLFVRTTNPRA